MYILGMGSANPTTKITNKFLEDLDIGTTAQWIEEKIGILERVTSLPIDYIKETRNADPREAAEVATTSSLKLGVEAAKQAIERAGLKVSDIGMIICNCCVPVSISPTEGQRIAEELSLDVPAYDVMTACPAFALHIDFVNNFKEEALPDYVLCVSTATLTQRVNYNDRTDGAIWGDGAAAWVVSTRHKGILKVTDTKFQSDPTRCAAVVVDRYGYFHQDGRAVRDFSVRQTVRLVRAIESENEIDWTRDIFVGHQANKTMLEQITNNRGVPPENHWHNVTYLGNQAGAGAPATIAQHWDEIRPGRKIVVGVVGAGLSWGSVLLEAT